MLTKKSTLTQFLIEERRSHPTAVGDLNSLIIDLALSVKQIGVRLARAPFDRDPDAPNSPDAHEDARHRLDSDATGLVLRATEWGGEVAGMITEELPEPYAIPDPYPRGKYLLCFDPLNGSCNIDINSTVGSVFSILRAPNPGERPTPEDFLQPGTEQVCAGYAVYGPSTMIVLSVGRGVHGFTLEPTLGEFILTHPDIRIPASPNEFAINSSNARYWQPAVRRYVEECLAGASGPRRTNFNMRWTAAPVGEAHRILMRGGVYLYPQDRKNAAEGGRLRLLYEANPLAYLIEQAGGRASNGCRRILDVQPDDIHQRVGLIFGDADEVERIEAYHREPVLDTTPTEADLPLYGTRGLFRTA